MVRITALACLLLLIGAGVAGADETPASPLPARVVTHHTLTLNGHRLDYQAIAETLPLTDRRGNETASIYTISYLADAAGARPVSFVFNGGPGAASVFLHLGALGPRILATPDDGSAPAPPVHLIDNPSTWLAFTDLVFVDPVGTGFSRGLGKDENPGKQFWDVRADIASLDSVVRLWLTRHERWGSPVYLVGESYGGFRAAALAHSLPRNVAVTVSGLVLISPALDLSMLNPGRRDLLAAAFLLPSYATVAAFWHPPPAGETGSEAEHFALGDYLTGLAAMHGRPAPGDRLIARIARITGLSEDIVRRYRGRVPRHIFAREIRRAGGEVVSIYDGTVARPASGDEEHGEAPDPLLQPAVAAFGAAFNAYVREALGYRTELPYHVLDREVSREWDWQGARREDGGGLALQGLEATLLARPQTRVLIVDGRDDLVTPYLASRWLADQLELPAGTRAKVRLRVYEGGHMMYTRPASRRALARDAAWVYGASAAPPSQ